MRRLIPPIPDLFRQVYLRIRQHAECLRCTQSVSKGDPEWITRFEFIAPGSGKNVGLPIKGGEYVCV